MFFKNKFVFFVYSTTDRYNEEKTSWVFGFWQFLKTFCITALQKPFNISFFCLLILVQLYAKALSENCSLKIYQCHKDNGEN